jgi:hypothetical protein
MPVLDRNCSPDGVGRYTVIDNRTGEVITNAHPSKDFFVLMLKDVHAQPALLAYAASCVQHNQMAYANEINNLAMRSGVAHPHCKLPDQEDRPKLFRMPQFRDTVVSPTKPGMTGTVYAVQRSGHSSADLPVGFDGETHTLSLGGGGAVLSIDVLWKYSGPMGTPMQPEIDRRYTRDEAEAEQLTVVSGR